MTETTAVHRPTIEADNPMVIIGAHSLVYRLIGDDGTLLYVGSSEHIADRLGAHQRTQPWWADVAVVRLEEYADFDTMRDAEWKAIEAEAPLHNVQRRPQPKVRFAHDRRGRPMIGRKIGPIPVPDEMRARLEAHAEDHGLKMAEACRALLDAGLNTAGY